MFIDIPTIAKRNKCEVTLVFEQQTSTTRGTCEVTLVFKNNLKPGGVHAKLCQFLFKQQTSTTVTKNWPQENFITVCKFLDCSHFPHPLSKVSLCSYLL